MEKATKVLAILFIIGIITFIKLAVTAATPKKPQAEINMTFWKYQCIDTMKISRDNARKWAKKSDLQKHIDWEIKTIKDLGANCVAIDTPYDDEFQPYMIKWITAARANHLHIWFRGNFAGWERWFDYPKISSKEVYLAKLESFIVNNEQLFEDGDIFTGAPEAENGGPFNQVEKNEYISFRNFLIDQYQTEKRAFAKINKNVAINWQSMNGGLAKRMLDQNTVDNIGHTITIDHYIKNSQDMGGFIQYFKNKYNSDVIIGEFGAPIPDINGIMNEDQQAEFVEKLMQELYTNRETVIGINYWDLYDGSTALMNLDQTPRKVTGVIKNYFSPAMITGTVTNSLGDQVRDVTIQTTDGFNSIKTDSQGNFILLIPPPRTVTLQVSGNSYDTSDFTIEVHSSGEKITQNFVINPKHPGLFYKLRLFWKQLWK